MNPRIGVSYDLLGDGKTAFKSSFGRFVASQDGAGTRGLGRNNPVVRSVIEADRTWNDRTPTLTWTAISGIPSRTRVRTDLEPEFWAKQSECACLCRRIDHQLEALSLGDHRTGPTPACRRHIATAGYYRRDFKNFTVNDNTFVTANDYSHYCVTAPVDARLPAAVASQICDLYDVSAALFGRRRSSCVLTPTSVRGPRPTTALTSRCRCG